MSLGWRDVARKLRGAPPELLASFGIKDGASDSELMKTILTELPDFKDAAGLDTSDLDADIEQWQKIRKDTAASKVLQNDAYWAKRRFQVADETFSLPVNEVLRQTGVIGEEETAGDAAGRAAGGGIGGAAVNMGVRVLTDPTSYINPAVAGGKIKDLVAAVRTAGLRSPQGAALATKGLDVAGKTMQGTEIIKVGQEYGFTSPEFAAAVAGGAAARGVSAGLSTAMNRATRGKAPVLTPEVVRNPRQPQLAPVAAPPRAVASGGTVHNPVVDIVPGLDSAGLADATRSLPAMAPDEPIVSPVKIPDIIAAPDPLEAIGPQSFKPPNEVERISKIMDAVRQNVEPEAIVKAAMAEDLVGLDEMAPKGRPIEEILYDEAKRKVADADILRIVNDLADFPIEPPPPRRSLADGMYPFYKHDLIQELGRYVDPKEWPKPLRDAMREGGGRAPLPPVGTKLKPGAPHPQARDEHVEGYGGLDVRAEQAYRDGWIDEPTTSAYVAALMRDGGHFHPDPEHPSNTGGVKAPPEEKAEALKALFDLSERAGLEPKRVMQILQGKGTTPKQRAERDRLRDIAADMDAFGGMEQLDNFLKEGGEDAMREAIPLPPELAGAKPNYNYGMKRFPATEFEDGIDKALFILAQKKPSKHDARFLAFVMSRTGMDEAQIRAAGAKLKDRIKAIAKDADPNEPLYVPMVDTIGHASRKKTGKKPSDGVLYHGTTAGNKDRIIQSGKFDPGGGERVYDYSQFGPSTTYFSRNKSGVWFKDGDARRVGYDATVEATLVPGANVVKIDSINDLEAVAGKIGMSAKEMMDSLFVDGLRDSPNSASHSRATETVKALEAAGVDGLDISPGYKDREMWEPAPDQVAIFSPKNAVLDASRKPTGKKPKGDMNAQMDALDKKDGGLAAQGLRQKDIAGLTRSLMGEASRMPPGVTAAGSDEIIALAKQHGGFHTPAFKAAVAQRAASAAAAPPPATPPPPSNGSGQPSAPPPPARPGNLPDYVNKEITFGGTGDAGALRRAAGSAFETHVSALHSKGMNQTADKFDDFGDKIDADLKLASNLEAEFKIMKVTEKDLDQVHALLEQNVQPTGSEKNQARIREIAEKLKNELDATHQVARERDPMSAAEWVENYYPRTGRPKGAPEPVHGTDNIQRPLDRVGQSKAASLTKSRTLEHPGDGDNFSRPITDPDELYAVLRRRRRNAGALKAGATMERTPENYPRTWKLILDDAMESAKARLPRDEDGVKKELSEGAAEKVLEKAEEAFQSLQLPDLFEAAAKDRPTSNWEQLVRNDDVVQASNAVIRGIDKMDPAMRKFTDAATSISSALQLGHAPFLNMLGIQSTYPLAKDALKNKGHGEVVASTIAAWKTLKATLGAGASLATDVAYHAARPFGARLSPNQKEFGTQGGWNLPRRAVVAADRAARTGVADALEDLIPYMRPETLKFIDRSVPLTDPKNIQIVRREISALSQGAGNSANRIKMTGNPAIDAVRELGLQYTGPSARLLEKAVPRAMTAPIGTAAAAILMGEISNTLRGISRGTGANVAGEETEDQKKGRTFDLDKPKESTQAVLKAIVSGDRSPHPGVRILQDIIPSIPFAQAALSNAAFGKGGGIESQAVGSMFPSVGALNQTVKSVDLAIETGDMRALLAIVNGPGVGNEWLKVVAFEDARRKAAKKRTLTKDTGIGQVPQNSGWAFKLDQMMTGRITFEEAMKDLITNTKPGIEGPANAYRRKENAQAAKRK